MKLRQLGIGVAIAALSAAGAAHGGVIITEIMYNSGGPGDGSATATSEWVEIYNSGPADQDISGWRLDDEDATNWSALPAGTTLAAGQVAVIFDSRFTNETTFRTDWAVPAQSLVLGVTFQSLGNTPSTQGEDLTIVDASATVVDAAFYDNGNGWPTTSNGRSIYTTVFTAAGNDNGANWLQSVSGTAGAHGATGTTFDAADVGSPGFVPVPEPASIGLALLGGVLSMRRSRRRENR